MVHFRDMSNNFYFSLLISYQINKKQPLVIHKVFLNLLKYTISKLIFVQPKKRQILHASGGPIVALLKLRLLSINSMSIRDSIDILLHVSMFTT